MTPAASHFVPRVLPDAAIGLFVHACWQRLAGADAAPSKAKRAERVAPLPPALHRARRPDDAPADVGPDDPITLREACRLVFRNQIKIATLRAEAARGHLTMFRIGRKDFTTLRHIREMNERNAKCLPAQKVPGSISTRDESSGSSAMDNVSSARGALKEMTKGLKKLSTNTSPNVVNLKRHRPR
jgi:hypothetical protein